MNNEPKHEQSDNAQDTAPSQRRANSTQNLQLDSIGNRRLDNSSSILESERLSIDRYGREKGDSASKSRGTVTGGILKQLIVETEDQLQFIQLQREKLELRLNELHLLLEELGEDTSKESERLEALEAAEEE